MRADDIIPPKEKINKVINFILNSKINDSKITVTGDEILKKYDYSFVAPKLIVTINYDIKPSASQDYKVDEFWGDEVRIDIASNGLSKSKVKSILDEAFNEYIDVMNAKLSSYKTL